MGGWKIPTKIKFYISAVCVTYKDANVFKDEKGTLGFIINMKKTVHTTNEKDEEEDEEEDEIDLPKKRNNRLSKSQTTTATTSRNI